MRVMAGNAPKLAVAVSAFEAAAQVHLFNMIDGLLVCSGGVRENECRDEFVQRHARAKIVQAATVGQHSGHTLKMTLLTNCLAQFMPQFSGVDNAGIELRHSFSQKRASFRVHALHLLSPHVLFPGTMTALAADGMA